MRKEGLPSGLCSAAPAMEPRTALQSAESVPPPYFRPLACAAPSKFCDQQDRWHGVRLAPAIRASATAATYDLSSIFLSDFFGISADRLLWRRAAEIVSELKLLRGVSLILRAPQVTPFTRTHAGDNASYNGAEP